MSLLSLSLRDGDWVKVRQILQHISHLQLGVNSTPTFAGLTLNELTVSKTCELAAGLNVLRVTGLQVDGTAMTGTLRGAYIDVSNGSTAATGTIRAMELKARTEAPGDIGNDVNVLEGLSISADSKDHSVTTMRAAEFILDGSTGGTITEAVGLRIANNLQANKATTSYGLQIYRDSFDYTADIQLSGGGTIGGSSGVMQLSSAGLLEVISTAGAQLRLLYDDILYADFTVASDGDLRISPTGNLELYTTIANKDIKINSADDIFVDAARAISFEAIGDYLELRAADYMIFRTGSYFQFRATDEIRFLSSNDSSDYIQFQTAADVPEITTVGICDLKITASSGEIDFDNENLTTTGNISGGTANFGDGGVTNYTQIDSGGRLLLYGTAQTWEDLRIVPGAFQFAGAADPTLQNWQPGGSGATFKVYKFVKNDEVFFTCQIPHNYKEGSDIKPHLHWTPCDRGNEENGNYVGWKIDYSWSNTDAAHGASATIDLSDACSGTDDQHELTASGTITGTSKTISSILIIRLYRSDTGTDDTWVGATAALSPAILEFDLHYEIDSLGSDLELIKDAP